MLYESRTCSQDLEQYRITAVRCEESVKNHILPPPRQEWCSKSYDLFMQARQVRFIADHQILIMETIDARSIANKYSANATRRAQFFNNQVLCALRQSSNQQGMLPLASIMGVEPKFQIPFRMSPTLTPHLSLNLLTIVLTLGTVIKAFENYLKKKDSFSMSPKHLYLMYHTSQNDIDLTPNAILDHLMRF